MKFLPAPETERAHNVFLEPHLVYRATLVEM